MNTFNNKPFVLRGARISKRGKQVISFNAAVIFGVLALAMPNTAFANCATLGATGGIVTCNVAGYTTTISGDGTVENPGTAQISYNRSDWTASATVIIDSLHQNWMTTAGQAAVRFRIGNGTANPGLSASSYGVIMRGDSHLRTWASNTATATIGINILDESAYDLSHVTDGSEKLFVTMEGQSRIAGYNGAGIQGTAIEIAHGTGGAGNRANATRDIEVTLRDDAYIEVDGLYKAPNTFNTRGININRTHAVSNSPADIIVSLADRARIVTKGRSAQGIFIANNGSNSTGDIHVNMSGVSSISTEQSDAIYVEVPTTSLSDIHFDLRGQRISAVGTGVSAVSALQRGLGNVNFYLDEASEISVSGDNARGMRLNLSNTGTQGDANINIQGTISIDGVDAQAFTATSLGAGPDSNIDLTIGSNATISATQNGVAGAAQAFTLVGPSAVSVNNNGAIVGGVSLYAPGGTSLVNSADSTITVAGARNVDVSVFGNLTNNGSIDVSASTSALAVNASVISNTGTIDAGSGLVRSGELSNSGTVTGGIDAGALTNSGDGNIILGSASTFNVAGDLTNDGVINIGANTATVGGNVNGSGTVSLDVDFSTGAGGTFVVTGDLTGDLVVSVNNLGAEPTAAGVAAVNFLQVNGAITGSVRLADGPINLGIYTFDLNVADGQIVAASVVNPVGAVYSAHSGVVAQGFASFGSLGSRAASRTYGTSRQSSSTITVSSKGSGPFGGTVSVGPWASIEGERSTRSPDSGDVVRSTNWAFEGGYDSVLDTSSEGTWIVGAGVRFGTVSATVENALGTSALDSEGKGVMLSASHYALTGSYLDFSLRHSMISAEMHDQNGGLLAKDVKSKATVASIEVGHRLALTQRSSLTPNAQMVFGRTETKGYTDANGLAVAAQTTDIRQFRFGAQFDHALKGGATLGLFGDYLRDLAATSTIEVNGNVLTSTSPRDWANVGLRLNAPLGASSAVSGEVGYQTAVGAASSNNESAFARLGFDLRF